MTTVTITVDDKGAQALLARVGALPGSRAMRGVSLEMKQEVYNAFRDRRDPSTGVAWPNLSPLTLALRARRGNHSLQPLIDTGAMYAGIEADSTATQASVTMGENVPDARAVWSQFGTQRAPARASFPMSQSAATPTQAWLDTVLKPIRDEIDKAIEV